MKNLAPFRRLRPARGRTGSASWILMQGWTGAWVEASEKAVVGILKTASRFIDAGRLAVVRGALTAENVDDVCRATGLAPDVFRSTSIGTPGGCGAHSRFCGPES